MSELTVGSDAPEEASVLLVTQYLEYETLSLLPNNAQELG
jgi:hypothetical protein